MPRKKCSPVKPTPREGEKAKADKRRAVGGMAVEPEDFDSDGVPCFKEQLTARKDRLAALDVSGGRYHLLGASSPTAVPSPAVGRANSLEERLIGMEEFVVKSHASLQATMAPMLKMFEQMASRAALTTAKDVTAAAGVVSDAAARGRRRWKWRGWPRIERRKPG